MDRKRPSSTNDPPRIKLRFRNNGSVVPERLVVANRRQRDFIEITHPSPDRTLDDLRGLDEIVHELRSQSGPIKLFAHADQARKWNLSNPKGIMLTGASGSGKRTIADNIVTEIRAQVPEKTFRYFFEKGSDISDFHYGSEVDRLLKLFQAAKEASPSVIFLEGLEEIVQNRDFVNDQFFRAALNQIKHFISTETPADVLLIVSINFNSPSLLRSALIQNCRFHFQFHLPIPGPSAREQILKHYLALKKIELSPENLSKMIQETENCTGKDIELLVNKIQDRRIDRIFPDGWMTISVSQFQKEHPRFQEDINWDLDILPVLDAKKAGTLV